nr:MAG TPA: hypothetical protein [Caudoviricetes sp.]
MFLCLFLVLFYQSLDALSYGYFLFTIKVL